VIDVVVVDLFYVDALWCGDHVACCAVQLTIAGHLILVPMPLACTQCNDVVSITLFCYFSLVHNYVDLVVVRLLLSRR